MFIFIKKDKCGSIKITFLLIPTSKMKKVFLILFLIVTSQVSLSQQESAFKEGEWFKFKMSYSNWLKAGNATLHVKKELLNNKEVYHVLGKGWTTGMIKWFFKVEDRYETYIDTQTLLPYKFVRNIDEGGYTKNIVINFDQQNKKAHVNNIKENKKIIVDTKPNVQDMVSTFYYLRNRLKTEGLKVGNEIKVDMFFDEDNYGFKLKYLGEETITTDFGKVKSLKFRPYVMAGRVFKEEESLTLWVSKDKNKVPLRIKADLAVGSLRADLEAFSGLKHPFEILVNN